MKRQFITPACIIKNLNSKSVMTVSQQIGLDWNEVWGENWDPFN